MSSHGSSSQGLSNTSDVSGPIKSSAYDCSFEQKCIDNYIYTRNYELPDGRLSPAPENSNYILDRLRRPRSSLAQSQFGEEALGQFKRANFLAKDEADVIADALPTILGGSSRKHRPAREVVFSNVQGMVEDIFKNPKPHLYYGARPEQIDQRVKQDLNNQIIPSTNQSHPAAPNFFVEVKGPGGSSVVNMRQACYGGAIGARGMHALQSYGQAEPTYDNRASTYSSTYENGLLQMYSHHPAQPLQSGGPPEYHMTPLGGWALTGSMQTFREGVGAFRNARDLAREQRNELIDNANAVARGQSVDRRKGSTNADTSCRTKTAKMSKSQDVGTTLGKEPE